MSVLPFKYALCDVIEASAYDPRDTNEKNNLICVSRFKEIKTDVDPQMTATHGYKLGQPTHLAKFILKKKGEER